VTAATGGAVCPDPAQVARGLAVVCLPKVHALEAWSSMWGY
jgi:hypothetical protein